MLRGRLADTKQWEQSATYFIDTSDVVDAFVKNSGLGFAIPYLHNGQMHDYVPDFIIRLTTDPAVHLILETKGYDPLEDVKRAAAERWVAGVNAEGTYAPRSPTGAASCGATSPRVGRSCERS